MPCYLFTYHTYGSWLPDRIQGFVRRGDGILQQDKQLANLYRNLMAQGTVSLDVEVQLTAIETLIDAASYIECRPHAIATDQHHLHLLVSWRDQQRDWKQLRSSFKKSVTIRLKAMHDVRKWLSRDASRKKVDVRSHFDHLVTTYLPRHRGWKWDERIGFYQTMDELRQRLSDEA